MASSLDDQQARHYIGSLLSDDDHFGQNNPTNTIETTGSDNAATGGVPPNAGPIGPPPNCQFWPEPPPPYSLCLPKLPQWTTVGHQGPDLMPPPPPPAGPFGQHPTATAVTRTDFYQSPYGRHGDWNSMRTASVDTYVSNGAPYVPHQSVSILKSLLAPNGPVHQHHYQNMYRHHQQHLDNTARIDPRMFSTPPPHPTLAYTTLEHNTLVQTDSYAAPEIPPKTVKEFSTQTVKTASTPPKVEDASPKTFSPEPAANLTIPPPAPGKSYRDVASKKERLTPNSSNASDSPVQPRQNLSGEKDAGRGTTMSIKRLTSANRINAGSRTNNKMNTSAGSGEHDEENSGRKENIHIAKGGTRVGKKAGENEFQKITHKKSKTAKSTRNDQVVIADEDGLAGNQTVDASSRFDVLQSLGTQVVPHRSGGITRRSLSSVTVHRELAIPSDKTAKMKADDSRSPENAMRDGSLEKIKAETKTTDSYKIEAKQSTLSAPRNSVKKTAGVRRELVPTDTSRCGRKQRNSVRKRQNTVTDYINFTLSLLFSLVKSALQWIVNLVTDISMQLWDISIYMVLATYTSVIYNCQRRWYSSLNAFRSFWVNIRVFNAKRIWTSGKEPIAWGLVENIQLPATGEEAMERILKCRGRDAYVILGLRADCTDDDIKRYFKRQAVLVHPDKNPLIGADESFKILSKAFEAIGTPDARAKYNMQRSPLHKEMEELWERLREKMNEARNTMYCDCGMKHSRVPVESIRLSEARYCKKCELRHPAKHNDIWAETRFFGLFWVYYTCQYGTVYDITQWAKCPRNRLKHIKADNHTVQYRLVTTFGAAVNRNTLKKNRTGLSRRDYDDEMCCYEDDDGCVCSTPYCYDSSEMMGMAASQQASYRPPERNSLNGERPRRAGRRRRFR